MKRFTTILGTILLGLFGLILFILFLPVMAVLMPYTYFDNWTRERRLKKYLAELGDKNFFCYNNRADAKDFIEKELIPKLDKEVDLIYLNGREPKSKYVRDHISLALYKLKNYTRFPHLLKIRNGQMIDESVNNEFFNVKNQNKPIDKLVEEINAFFELGSKATKL